jgi:hypothetical protein
MTHFTPWVQDEWRYDARISSDGSGQFSLFFALRNPLAAINGSGTYPRAEEFAKLYDEYHIQSLTVVFDPTQLQVQTGHVGIAVDYDSVGTGTYTFGDLRDNQYLRDYRALNQISYAAREVPLSEGTYRERPAVIHQKGWYDFNSPPEEGFIVMTGEDFTPSAPVGRVLLTLKVKMRRRRTIGLARDAREAAEKSAAVVHQQQTQMIQPLAKAPPRSMTLM